MPEVSLKPQIHLISGAELCCQIRCEIEVEMGLQRVKDRRVVYSVRLANSNYLVRTVSRTVKEREVPTAPPTGPDPVPYSS